jgi:hypothetical protein
MEMNMAKENCSSKFSVSELIALGSLFLTIFGGFFVLLRDMKTEIIKSVDKVETKVERVETKVDEHIQFHLLNPQNCVSEDKPKEVSYAKSDEGTIRDEGTSREEARPAERETVGRRVK